MKTYKHLFEELCRWQNIILAWRKARKGKTKKNYVIEFESDLRNNLLSVKHELENQTYKPLPLKRFIVRDPKTRVIHSSAFRDRIVYHAIVNVIEPIFEKVFIYDSCASRIGKGNLFALKRFDEFKRKVSKNGEIKGWFNDNQVKGYCLKADIKHYFQEVNHETLLKIIRKKIADERVMSIILKILDNFEGNNGKGMPLGNLTSQFFANVYLNELDYFVKHKLKAEYYIRYVDDFVILHNSKKQLEDWKKQIEVFLRENLKIELHPQKSKIVSLSQGVDFVGFRNFYYFRLLRKRNINNMKKKIEIFKQGLMKEDKFLESFQGWSAYAKWANTFKLRRRMLSLSSQ
jgi:retron-type reverse transcriptase